MALRGELPLFERAPRDKVVAALHAAGFAPHPSRPPAAGRPPGAVTTASLSKVKVDESGDLLRSDGGRARGDYAHLLNMPIVSLSAERVAALEEQITRKRAEADELRSTSELQMWHRELEALRPALEAYLQERCGTDDGIPSALGGAVSGQRTTKAVGRTRKTAAKPKVATKKKSVAKRAKATRASK